MTKFPTTCKINSHIAFEAQKPHNLYVMGFFPMAIGMGPPGRAPRVPRGALSTVPPEADQFLKSLFAFEQAFFGFSQINGKDLP